MGEPSDLLRDWLGHHGVDAEVEVVGRAPGGLSQETWFVVVRRAGHTAPLDAVLRLPTPASGGRAIGTQVAALTAVAGTGVPAPTLLWSGDERDGLDGRPFLLMSRADGRVPVGWHVLADQRRVALAHRAMEALARLHAIDPAATPFADAGPHPLMTLDGLVRAYERLAPVPTPLRAACGWLARHRPADADATDVLVHGDFRMGNMVVSDDRLVAVLDWELTAPGPREVDLAWCFLPVFEEAGVDVDTMVRHYERHAGVRVDRGRLAWHRVAALVRLAYYSLSGTRAFDLGRSRDLRLAALRLRLPTTVGRLAAAIRHAEVIRAGWGTDDG